MTSTEQPRPPTSGRRTPSCAASSPACAPVAMTTASAPRTSSPARRRTTGPSASTAVTATPSTNRTPRPARCATSARLSGHGSTWRWRATTNPPAIAGESTGSSARTASASRISPGGGSPAATSGSISSRACSTAPRSMATTSIPVSRPVSGTPSAASSSSIAKDRSPSALSARAPRSYGPRRACSAKLASHGAIVGMPRGTIRSAEPGSTSEPDAVADDARCGERAGLRGRHPAGVPVRRPAAARAAVDDRDLQAAAYQPERDAQARDPAADHHHGACHPCRTVSPWQDTESDL